ncbi:DctP family TRAP transporter solute-binding subunit [Aneurinibacillus tyrosinisolvens]|uniref:DctP family TRAP transporter solute-binding subunit n=1 Tax=Aneurinibacillus tyrosinisolvens TaxID=1443435 RepID=UPI00063EF24A|nr:DctP family TRAP transporter solute-binding subunit [Aneurinibacillus tyrosinisolvens]
MKSLWWLILFLFAGLAIAVAVGFGFNKEEPIHYDQEQAGLNKKVVIRFSHVVAENTPKGLAVNLFAKLVREKTNGMVEIRTYPNATLFDDATEFEALRQGQVEMIAPSISKLSARYPEWMVMDLPYAFMNERMVSEAMDGRLGQLLFQAIDDANVMGMALWDNGFKQMTANREIIKPSDFQNMKIRIMDSPVLRSQFQVLGAQAESYSFNDLYRQLESGAVEGEENTLSNIYSKRLYQVQTHMTVSNHGYLGYTVLMNRDVWNKLSGSQQEAIRQAMEETTVWIRHYAKEMNNKALTELKKDKGLSIHYQTDAERQEWQKALLPVYNQYKNAIGETVIREWRKVIEEKRDAS